jgi:hypothetical protein
MATSVDEFLTIAKRKIADREFDLAFEIDG